jgi:hypothetical protein
MDATHSQPNSGLVASPASAQLQNTEAAPTLSPSNAPTNLLEAVLKADPQLMMSHEAISSQPDGVVAQTLHEAAPAKGSAPIAAKGHLSSCVDEPEKKAAQEAQPVSPSEEITNSKPSAAPAEVRKQAAAGAASLVATVAAAAVSEPAAAAVEAQHPATAGAAEESGSDAASQPVQLGSQLSPASQVAPGPRSASPSLRVAEKEPDQAAERCVIAASPDDIADIDESERVLPSSQYSQPVVGGVAAEVLSARKKFGHPSPEEERVNSLSPVKLQVSQELYERGLLSGSNAAEAAAADVTAGAAAAAVCPKAAAGAFVTSEVSNQLLSSEVGVANMPGKHQAPSPLEPDSPIYKGPAGQESMNIDPIGVQEQLHQQKDGPRSPPRVEAAALPATAAEAVQPPEQPALSLTKKMNKGDAESVYEDEGQADNNGHQDASDVDEGVPGCSNREQASCLQGHSSRSGDAEGQAARDSEDMQPNYGGTSNSLDDLMKGMGSSPSDVSHRPLFMSKPSNSHAAAASLSLLRPLERAAGGSGELRGKHTSAIAAAAAATCSHTAHCTAIAQPEPTQHVQSTQEPAGHTAQHGHVSTSSPWTGLLLRKTVAVGPDSPPADDTACRPSQGPSNSQAIDAEHGLVGKSSPEGPVKRAKGDELGAETGPMMQPTSSTTAEPVDGCQPEGGTEAAPASSQALAAAASQQLMSKKGCFDHVQDLGDVAAPGEAGEQVLNSGDEDVVAALDIAMDEDCGAMRPLVAVQRKDSSSSKLVMLSGAGRWQLGAPFDPTGGTPSCNHPCKRRRVSI